MSILTPPLNARGRYTVKAPWTTDPTKLYTCIAIRSFPDVYKLGKDVFEEYYNKLGLTKTDVAFDAAQNANIITLYTDTGDLIYIPDSYILSFPNMGQIEYSHLVLSLSVGAIPNYLDLTFLKAQLASTASDIIGTVPTVYENRASSIGAVSPEQHEVLEVARVAAVSNRVTDYAKLIQANLLNVALIEKITMLEKIIKDKNLIP